MQAGPADGCYPLHIFSRAYNQEVNLEARLNFLACAPGNQFSLDFVGAIVWSTILLYLISMAITCLLIKAAALNSGLHLWNSRCYLFYLFFLHFQKKLKGSSLSVTSKLGKLDNTERGTNKFVDFGLFFLVFNDNRKKTPALFFKYCLILMVSMTKNKPLYESLKCFHFEGSCCKCLMFFIG